MATNPGLVEVEDLFVQCSFPVKPNPRAASDSCNKPAMSVVEDQRGSLLYRCTQHEGQINRSKTGPILYSIPRPR